MERDPLDQLVSSHRRLEERLAELADAARALALADEHDARRDEARAVIDDVLAFLGRSVARHEHDEEASLFPRLGAVAGLGEILDRLREEHAEQRRLQDDLRDLLAGAADPARSGEVAQVVERLRVSYQRHVACEEQDVLPAARKALRAEDLAAMAAEMEARRGRGGGGGGGGGGRGGGGGGGGRGGGGGGGGRGGGGGGGGGGSGGSGGGRTA